jgi:hypothetical protein
MQPTVWKTIPNTRYEYLVSNMGDVVWVKNGARIPMTLSIDSLGYKKVTI